MVGGRSVDARLRISKRARRLRLTVTPGQPVEFVVPRRTPVWEMEAFLREHQGWLEGKLAWARRVRERERLLGLDRPGVVWVRGDPVAVRFGDRSARPVAQLRGDALLVNGPREQAREPVERWYRREARRVIEELVRSRAAELGVSVHSISIRDPRTRWGSCSVNGRISFAWRLLLPPPGALEYVIDHELCHLRVPNHSARFRALLDRVHPGWRDDARWLKQHEWELQEYRTSWALEEPRGVEVGGKDEPPEPEDSSGSKDQYNPAPSGSQERFPFLSL